MAAAGQRKKCWADKMTVVILRQIRELSELVRRKIPVFCRVRYTLALEKLRRRNLAAWVQIPGWSTKGLPFSFRAPPLRLALAGASTRAAAAEIDANQIDKHHKNRWQSVARQRFANSNKLRPRPEIKAPAYCQQSLSQSASPNLPWVSLDSASFLSTGRGDFLFDASKRKWGRIPSGKVPHSLH